MMSQRTGTGKLLFRSHVALITFTYVSVQSGETTCTLIHASWAYPKPFARGGVHLGGIVLLKKEVKYSDAIDFFFFVLYVNGSLSLNGLPFLQLPDL